jgi:hypothetical protein
MFSYAPQESDQSGRIIAQGMMGAAQTNAQTMGQMGQDIGGALAGIGQMYGEIEGRKAKGRAFKDVFKVVSPSMGISMDQLEAVSGGKLKNDMDWYNVSETISPLMPSMINAQLVGNKLGVQQQQPFVNAGLKNAANIAGGNATYTPPAGMAPVEPPLPTGGPAPVDVAPAPVASGIPGGQASIDAINADRKRRGLPPIQ